MKKIFILLLILFVLAVAISASPILTYFQSLGAEEPAGTTEAAGENGSAAGTSDEKTAETSDETADTSDAEEKKEPNRTAILFAVILSGLTILAALICYLRKSDPNRD